VAASRRAGAYGARIAIREDDHVGGTRVMRDKRPDPQESAALELGQKSGKR
jgi:hypothetical protein